MQLYSKSVACILTALLFLVCLPGCSDFTDYAHYDSRLKVGVFGGSISVRKESEEAKNIWQAYMSNINIISCGIEGAGFSSITHNENIPVQIARAPAFDVYILWASSNDVARSPLGLTTEQVDSTQDGGIIKSIRLIKRKNKQALILFFTSVPRFDSPAYRYRMQDYVNDQIDICDRSNIPYLDLFRLSGFDSSNFQPYYLPDRTHMSAEGYQQIGYMQMEFIRENIKNYVGNSRLRRNRIEL
ncbi:MAG: SGNH/GDSL hydrolase family protein [Tannerellaceae bacterium]|jgi:hypothetical protein|nr:SGNH/GDSL hydrolase family protein [Tannerellaceae bacterium]